MEACPTLVKETIISSLYVCVSVLHGETRCGESWRMFTWSAAEAARERVSAVNG